MELFKTDPVYFITRYYFLQLLRFDFGYLRHGKESIKKKLYKSYKLFKTGSTFLVSKKLK